MIPKKFLKIPKPANCKRGIVSVEKYLLNIPKLVKVFILKIILCLFLKNNF